MMLALPLVVPATARVCHVSTPALAMPACTPRAVTSMIAMDPYPESRHGAYDPKVLSCAEMPESVKELKSEVNALHTEGRETVNVLSRFASRLGRVCVKGATAAVDVAGHLTSSVPGKQGAKSPAGASMDSAPASAGNALKTSSNVEISGSQATASSSSIGAKDDALYTLEYSKVEAPPVVEAPPSLAGDDWLSKAKAAASAGDAEAAYKSNAAKAAAAAAKVAARTTESPEPPAPEEEDEAVSDKQSSPVIRAAEEVAARTKAAGASTDSQRAEMDHAKPATPKEAKVVKATKAAADVKAAAFVKATRAADEARAAAKERAAAEAEAKEREEAQAAAAAKAERDAKVAVNRRLRARVANQGQPIADEAPSAPDAVPTPDAAAAAPQRLKRSRLRSESPPQQPVATSEEVARVRASAASSAQPSAAPRGPGPVLKVVGIGGGGCSTVSRLPSALGNLIGESVDLVMLNTDSQALGIHKSEAAQAVEAYAALSGGDASSSRASSRASAAIRTMALGQSALGGKGAGGVAANGAMAAEEAEDAIRQQLDGADLVFLTAGMGGGTGSGGAPIVARAARSTGAVTVALVSKPFEFEGGQRARVAAEAIEELSEHADVLVVVENERLLDLLPEGASVAEALATADDVARQAIIGVATLIGTSQLINVDLADVRSVMRDAGRGLITIGRGSGAGGASAAVESALSSPLLNIKLERVTGCAYAISGGPSLTLHEVNQIGQRLASIFTSDAQVIFGAAIDPTLDGDEIVLTLIATGMRPPPGPPKLPSQMYNVFEYRPPVPLAPPDPEEGEEVMQRYEQYLETRKAVDTAYPRDLYGLPQAGRAAMGADLRRADPATPPMTRIPPKTLPPKAPRSWHATPSPPPPAQPMQTIAEREAARKAPPLTPQQQANLRRQEWAMQEAEQKWVPKAKQRANRWRPKVERQREAARVSVSARVTGPDGKPILSAGVAPPKPDPLSWRTREVVARPSPYEPAAVEQQQQPQLKRGLVRERKRGSEDGGNWGI